MGKKLACYLVFILFLMVYFFPSFAYAVVVVKPIPNFHYVSDGIYRSGLLDKGNIDSLRDYGIKSIISMKTNLFEVEVERKWAQRNGVAFRHIPIQILFYTEQNKHLFWQVYFAMLNMQKPLLVHCTRGSERTGVSVAIYRILNNNFTYTQAVNEMDFYEFDPLFSEWKKFIYNVSLLTEGIIK